MFRSFNFRIKPVDWCVDPRTMLREITVEVQRDEELVCAYKKVIRPEDFESFLDVYFKMARAALLEELTK